MIEVPAIIGALAVIAVMGLRPIRLMNLATVLHAVAILFWAGYAVLAKQLPLFFQNSHYFFLDALGAYEILISAIIFLLASIYAAGYVSSLIEAGELNQKNVRLFYAVFNLLLSSVVFAFSSNNMALLWIFAELTTVFSAILIVLLNAKENITAAIKYVFITSTAMLFSFVGLILLFVAAKQADAGATLNWSELIQSAPELSSPLLAFSLALIFIGFAAKSGIAPFHTWLPPAHSKAPSDVSVLLSGSILNIGIYAILRIYSLSYHTPVQELFSWILLVFGLATVGIAALSMVVRTNLKKLIAFSSIEHMGIMTIGISVGAIIWVLYYSLAHSLAKALLFFSAGIFHRQYHGIKAEFMHDIFDMQPLASWGFAIGSMAVLGMPLFPIFLPKFFILAQLGKVSVVLLLLALLLLLIVAGSFVWFGMQLIQHKEKELPKYAVPFSMKFPIIILILLLLVLGLYYPEGMRLFLEKAVQQIGI